MVIFSILGVYVSVQKEQDEEKVTECLVAAFEIIVALFLSESNQFYLAVFGDSAVSMFLETFHWGVLR